MMKPNVKRRPRTRSSKRACEEKFCCPFIDSEAKYYCEDCKSAQCQACESNLHQTKVKYDFHYRKPLPVAAEGSLCQSRKLNLVCKDKNYPDLWCEQCKAQLCFTCFDNYHTTEKRRQHINVSMTHHLKKQQEQQQQQQAQVDVELYESTELYQDALSDMIKPQAPFSLADESDSVTFCSFPQESDPDESEMQFMSMNAEFTSDQTCLTSSSHLHDDDAGFSNAQRKGANIKVQEIHKSFILLDDQNTLQVTEDEDFLDKLGCGRADTFKVVSVLGTPGDRQAHILNHTFFGGQEMFKPSSAIHAASTTGVWCSLSKDKNVIVMNTEGLQCSSAGDSPLASHLLAFLALSDIVIHCMGTEHQRSDIISTMNSFLKDYHEHFKLELQATSQQYGVPLSGLWPTFIVLHKAVQIQDCGGLSEMIQQAVKSENPAEEVFPKICFVSIETAASKDERGLPHCLTDLINDVSVRIPRKTKIILQFAKALNMKLGQEIDSQLVLFPKDYFACTSRCLACGMQCCLNINHDIESTPHDVGRDRPCQYNSSYGNKVFMCRTCLGSNRQSMVVPKTSSSSDNSLIGLTKYIWSGYVYECSNCGVICRSREHWYGNESETELMHVEYRHIWPQGPSALDGTHNAARKVLESFHIVADTISSVGACPVKYLTEWTTDKISPSYWEPNSNIIKCCKCQHVFDSTEQKHHCRACGKGFCTNCSSKKRAVPERGWGSEPVRVCDACYNKPNEEMDSDVAVEQGALTARKVGEVVSSTFNAMISALDYPIGVIKKSAKPTYWVPDEEITECHLCQRAFGPRLSIHHCRVCGQGVCGECSPNKCCVPLRGWDYPVRVCSKCESKKDKI